MGGQGGQANNFNMLYMDNRVDRHWTMIVLGWTIKFFIDFYSKYDKLILIIFLKKIKMNYIDYGSKEIKIINLWQQNILNSLNDN